MLEALGAVVASASYAGTDQKERARGLVINAVNQLTAVQGLTLTADGGSATTAGSAIGLARQNVNAQAVAGTFSLDAKQRALGILVRLQGELASQGLG